MNKVCIKEIGETVPFGLLKTYEVTDDRYRPIGEHRVLYGVPAWVNDKILETCNDYFVTCILEEDSEEDGAVFYTAPGVLVELSPRRYNIVNFGEAIKTVKAILKRGNDAEVRRKGDGYIVLEVKKTIKYTSA